MKNNQELILSFSRLTLSLPQLLLNKKDMKKILFLFSAVIMLLASCEGPAGRDGLDGRDGYATEWVIKTYTINSNQWQLVNGVDQLNSFYQAEVRIPELDVDIYEDGAVLCYMFQDVNGDEVQTMLPFTIPRGVDNGNGTEDLWTETYACDFTVGSIMFYVNYSDFYTNNRPPTTSFKVALIY